MGGKAVAQQWRRVRRRNPGKPGPVRGTPFLFFLILRFSYIIKSMEKIIVYTDGGCSGNPGPGGWACVIIAEGQARQLSGGEKLTTNNKMELMAAISALSAIKNTARFAGIPVEVNIDSQYVKNGITQWIFSWKKKGWKTADKKPVKNQDLWMALDALNSSMSVEWKWVKGHAGVEYNEVCDSLCQEEIARHR